MTEDLKHVSKQLETIIRLLATVASAQENSLHGKCLVLAQAGLKANDIADVLGTTAGTVRVELSRERKKKKGKS
jgi:DNA-directed RNA polymerase specialized sigma24 family protein